jgi:Mrp family chromosome partitioning ATPase/uncharacterized protein involved in exopolysaccharide biosynthesis
MPANQPPAPPRSAEPTIDFRAYVGLLWRRKWAIAAVFVLGTVGGLVYAKLQARDYTASTQLYIQYPDPTTPVAQIVFPGTSPQSPDTQQLQDITTLIQAPSVAQAAYAQLHLPVGSAGSVSAVTQSSTAAVNNGTSIIILSATSGSPTLAARLVDAYASAYLASRVTALVAGAHSAIRSQTAQLARLRTSTQTRDQQTNALTAIAQLTALAANPTSGARVLGNAPVPTVSTASSSARDIAFGAILGLVFGVALAFCLEAFDRRLVRVPVFADVYRLPVLAVIPHVDDPAPLVGGTAAVPGRAVETVRSLRINLWPTGEDAPRTILVASAVAGEGRSQVVRDLALAYAEAGQRTLMIDANLRRPSLSALLGVNGEYTLEDVLVDEVDLQDAAVAVRHAPAVPGSTNGRGASVYSDRDDGLLALLPSRGGVENAGALLASRPMQKLLADARDEYDVVIIDSSPLLVVSDAVPLLEMVDTTLVVARYELTTRDLGRRFRELLELAPRAPIAGMVVTDARDVPFVDEGYRTYDRGYGAHRPAVKR